VRPHLCWGRPSDLFSLSSSLPPNVVVLKVVETSGKTRKKPPPALPAGTLALVASLDIKVDMPGNIFLRGHGLDSEWPRVGAKDRAEFGGALGARRLDPRRAEPAAAVPPTALRCPVGYGSAVRRVRRRSGEGVAASLASHG
jgi:hypothetical protein